MKIENRKVLYEYVLGERFEAGLVLTGSEIKAIRGGRMLLAHSFIRVLGDGVYLVNAHIPAPPGADIRTYQPDRSRKLLLHKKEIQRIMGILASKGSKGISGNLTVAPVSCYIKHGVAKLELAIARGKKQHEKRELLKQKDIERDVEVQLRGKDI